MLGRQVQTRRWSRLARLEHLEARQLLAGDLATTELVSIRLEVTDLSGVPISQVETGESFLVKAYLQDRRGQPGVTVPAGTGYSNEPQGFHSAFISITYDKDGFDFDPTYDIIAGPEVDPLYDDFTPQVDDDGFIGRLGVHDVASGFLQPQEIELFSFRMIAEQPGIYNAAEAFQPHFHFDVLARNYDPNNPEHIYSEPETWDIDYVNGVPQLERLTGYYEGGDLWEAIDGNDEYISIASFGGELLMEDDQLFFQGVDLEVLPASTPNAEFDIRFVKNATTPTNGEVTNLPSNLTYIDEWETFYVEIYAKVPEGSTDTGLTSATVQLDFTPGDFEFVQAIGNTSGDPAIRYSVAYTDDQSESGSVTVSFTTLTENLGDDGRHALVGRILVRSLMEVANDTSGGYIYSVPSSEIALTQANATLVDRNADTHAIVEGNTPSGGVSFDVWPVMYDADEDRRVGLSDFSGFVSAFGLPADTPKGRRFDFDKNGVVGLSDFNLFVQNFGQTGDSLEDRIYHNQFPSAYQSAALMGSMSLEGEPVHSPAPVALHQAGPPMPLTDQSVSNELRFVPMTSSNGTPTAMANPAEQGSGDGISVDEPSADTLVSTETAWTDQSDLLWQTANSSGDVLTGDEASDEFSEYADEVLALWDNEDSL